MDDWKTVHMGDLPKRHYYLPDQGVDAEGKRYETDANSVVLIGANGSGKTRLGEWLERKYPRETHRISSLRDLSLPRTVRLLPFKTAVNQMTYGQDKEELSHNWLYSYDSVISRHRTVTTPVSNFEPSIAAVYAKDNDANRSVSRILAENGDVTSAPSVVGQARSRPEVRMQALFSLAFPHRQIYFRENTVYAVDSDIDLTTETMEKGYNGCELSDGERAALYVIAQALCLPKNKIVIVDEPELHLHLSVIKPLWSAIEKERPDCLFIYITHDLEFAEAHRDSDKIWVRGYDGQKWEFERIDEDGEIPSDLELELMGSRRPVIFVEGTYSSFDYQLYSLLYPSYQVIPCPQGCEQVIESVRAFKESKQLHHVNVHGIIDRDRRSKERIVALNKQGVHVLEVAEVENLFLLEDVMNIVAEQMGLSQSSVEEAKSYVIDTKFKNQIDSLAAEHFRDTMTAQLKATAATKNVEETVKLIQGIADKAKMLKTAIDKEYQDVSQSNDYMKVLSLLNDKSVVKNIGEKFKLKRNEYVSTILRWTSSMGEIGDKLREAFRRHLPSFENADYQS